MDDPDALDEPRFRGAGFRRAGLRRAGPVRGIGSRRRGFLRRRLAINPLGPQHRRRVRLGWSRQDNHLGRARTTGRAARAPLVCGHDRSRQAARRLTRARQFGQHASSGGRSVGRGALGTSARPEEHLRRAHPKARRHSRAGRRHPPEPALPEPDRGAFRHPGVHGDGEALRARRGGPFRPDRGGHPAFAKRPRLLGGSGPLDALFGQPAFPVPSDADSSIASRVHRWPRRHCSRPSQRLQEPRS